MTEYFKNWIFSISCLIKHNILHYDTSIYDYCYNVLRCAIKMRLSIIPGNLFVFVNSMPFDS